MRERRINLELQPLADVRRSWLEVGVEENPAISVADALEPQRHMEVLVAALGSQIPVIFRDPLAVDNPVHHLPFLMPDLDPAAQVLSIEHRHPLLIGLFRSSLWNLG